MARGATLSRLVQLTRAEARHNTSANAGLNAMEKIKTTIARTYEDLLRDHDWPHLIERHTVDLSAGQYRYSLPTTVEPERILSDDAFAYYPALGRRYPIHATEITWHHLNTMDPDLAAGRMDPVQLWMIIPDDMIQVWPCPATTGGQISFRGVRKVPSLVADGDVCQLDDRIVSLFSAAELLGPEEGQPLLRQAQSLLSALKGSLNKRRSFDMRGDCAANMRRPAQRLEVVYVRAG